MLSAVPMFSAQALDAKKDSIKGLTLSPLRTELNIQLGTSVSGVLTVTNSTDKSMSVTMSAEEFSVINQNYDYSFLPDSDIAKWVSFKPSGIDLKAGESKKISYTVGVPLNAEPAGAYISLFASTRVDSSTDAASSQQRVASLLYITVFSDVLGDSTQVGHVLSVSSPWLVSGRGTWSATLQNAGKTHYRSNYEVKIDNIFGGTVASMSGNALILPSTIRAISDVLPLPQWPGVYKIVYTIGLGANAASTVETRYMLYMPPIAIIVVVTVVIVLVLGLLRRRTSKH